jgi:hypothetical protein
LFGGNVRQIASSLCRIVLQSALFLQAFLHLLSSHTLPCPQIAALALVHSRIESQPRRQDWKVSLQAVLAWLQVVPQLAKVVLHEFRHPGVFDASQDEEQAE